MEKRKITTDELFDSLITVLINYERNKDILSETPHRRFLDLALVPVLLNKKENSYEYVSESLIRDYKLDCDKIIDFAYLNHIRTLGIQFRSMFDIFMKIIPDEAFMEQSDNPFDISSKNTFVLTNKYMLYGASLLYNKELLEMIGSLFKKDYYIIPSSVNEIIIFPNIEYNEVSEIKDLIRMVNENVLESEDLFLSNSLYKYKINYNSIAIL